MIPIGSLSFHHRAPIPLFPIIVSKDNPDGPTLVLVSEVRDRRPSAWRLTAREHCQYLDVPMVHATTAYLRVWFRSVGGASIGINGNNLDGVCSRSISFANRETTSGC